MIAIRPARAGDAALIVSLLRALADYEKMLDYAKMTEAQVETAILSPGARVFCDIAEADGEPVGLAVWYYNFSTFEGRAGIYLEDIFVAPEARGTGAGLALMRHLARRCRDEGLKRLKWEVLDWNPAIAFYERLGAKPSPEWLPYSLHGRALMALAES
jgi:GNAT superfamily N-acetyltransferase